MEGGLIARRFWVVALVGHPPPKEPAGYKPALQGVRAKKRRRYTVARKSSNRYPYVPSVYRAT